MTLLRLVLSDLHLGTGTRRGQLNPLEDFIHDDRLVELLAYYDQLAGTDGSIELISERGHLRSPEGEDRGRVAD